MSAFGLKFVAQQSLRWDLRSARGINYTTLVGVASLHLCSGKGELLVQSHFCWKKDFTKTDLGAVMRSQEHAMAVPPWDPLIQEHTVQVPRASSLAVSPLPRAPMSWYLVY